MALNAMFQITSNYEEYSRLTTDLKNQLDWQASMVGAERKGRAEGRAEGIAEGMAQVAQKMKAMGFSDEQIHSVTAN